MSDGVLNQCNILWEVHSCIGDWIMMKLFMLATKCNLVQYGGEAVGIIMNLLFF